MSNNPNRGYLAKNLRKEKDTHPDYSGALNVAGQEYWLSAWVEEKKRDDGSTFKYFSLSVKPKVSNGGQDHGGNNQAAPPAPPQDDLPF